MRRRGRLQKTREARVRRRTEETDVEVYLNLDRVETPKIQMKRRFFKHMLASLALHGKFELRVEAEEFEPPDDHHLVEDVALTFGEALLKALGDKRGIERFGWAAVPMDEALVLASIDLSGRPYYKSNLSFKHLSLGDMTAEMVNHFFHSLSHAGRFNLHLLVFRGSNDHHKAEASFKAVGLALAQAVRRIGDRIPSLKGVL